MKPEHVVVKKWAVLYTHSDSVIEFSMRRIFSDYESALMCFNRGCNFNDNDYDGYNYVALLFDSGDCVGFRQIAWRDNLGSAWDIEG